MKRVASVPRVVTVLAVLMGSLVGLGLSQPAVASPAALWGTETIAGSSVDGPAAPALAVTPDGTKGVLAWFGDDSVYARGFTVDTSNGNQTWSVSTYELAPITAAFGSTGQRLEAVISDDGTGVAVGWSEDLTTSPYVTAASITYSGATSSLDWAAPVTLVGANQAVGGFLSLAGSADATSLLAGWVEGTRLSAWGRGLDVDYSTAPPTITTEASELRFTSVALTGGGGSAAIPLKIAMDPAGDDAVVAFIDENIGVGFPEATAAYFDGRSGNWSPVGGPPGFFSADVSQFALQVSTPSSGLGRALWTWVDVNGTVKSAVASLDPANGATWSSEITVATGADAGLALSMTDGAERAMVVWRDDATDDLLARSLADPTSGPTWDDSQVAYDASVATVPAGPLSTVALNDGAGGASPGTVAVVGTAVGSGGYAARVAVATVDYALASPQSWSAQVPAGTAATSGANPTAFMSNNGRLVTTSFGAVVPGGTPYEARAVSAQIAEAPGAPVATSGDTQATVTITPPAYPISPTPTSYLVTASPGGATCTVSGASGSCTVTGLTNGTSYTFTSTATWPNSTTSGPSPVSNSVTPAAGPTINTQPADDTVNAGATATFNVVATAGSGSLSYQWEVLPSGGSWGNVSGGSGATTASYTTPTLSSADDSAQYRVIVTDSNGSTTSNAATLTVISPPGAPNQPTVSSYGNATATVAVTAGAGGTPASYTVTPSPLPSSAPTTCTVSGASGSCSFNNLTNGTAYTFSATATNPAGTSAASPSSSSVTPLAPPGQPGQPTATVTGATSATVTITPPSTGGPPATYTVTPTPAPGSAPTTCTVTPPATTCSFSNLTGGASYTFAATATNVGGTSIASPSSSSTQISAPGTPGTPTAVAGPASATVTVVAPSTGGPPSTYLVTASGGGGQTCTVTVPATSCVVSGLTPGTSYTFTSTATNGVGTSGLSASSNAVTPTANVAPGTPGTPTAVASNGGATVTVVAPVTGGTPSSYTVTASPTPSSGSATCTVTVPATSCAFNNLTNGTAYTFTSTATNIVGTSGASAASSPVTPLAAPGTPGQPLAAAASATSATVTITAPSSGGAPATYLVTASGGGGQTCTVTSPATSCTVTGLSSGGSYTFTSTATNVGGTSGSSVASASITLSAPGVPGTPTAIAGAGSATVSITPPSSGGTPSSYTVTSSPAGGTCTVTVPATSCVVSGLTPGTSYTFTATATNGLATSGASAASNAVTPTSPTPPTPVTPSAPGSVSVVAGSGSATVSWSAPANPGSFAVTQYRVIASPGGASCLVPASSTTCTLSPLTNGTTYTVSVSALSGAGWGAAATSAPFTPGASVPATPSIASVLAGNGAVTVSVAAGSGGGPVSSYLVTASPGGATCTVTAPATSCAVTGLTNGTAYTFTATATGPGGTSGSSPASSAATPVAPITPTPAPLPAPLAPGQSNLQQGGQTVLVTVTPNGQSNGLVVNATGFTMTLQGENEQGRPLPLSNGVLVLEQDRTLRTTGTGFFPNTEVDIYLDPPAVGDGSLLRANAGAIYLGSVRTDSLGEFNGTVQIDPSIGAGDHVVQAIGVTQNNVERAMSLGVRVVEDVATRPGPVRDLAAVTKAKTSVKVSWRAPLNDGGAPVTSYKIRHRLKGEERYRGRLQVEGLTGTVRGLLPGKVYFIRVRAVNAVGTGPSDTFVRVRLPKG